MTTELPGDMLAELKPLLSMLEKDLGIAVSEPMAGPRVSLTAGTCVLPNSAVEHWRRWGRLPPAVVRELAYEAKLMAMGSKSTPAHRAADAAAYAEVFLREFLQGDVHAG